MLERTGGLQLGAAIGVPARTPRCIGDVNASPSQYRLCTTRVKIPPILGITGLFEDLCSKIQLDLEHIGFDHART